MKRGIFVSALLALWLTAVPALAENVDTVTWLKGDYIGVGGIDMSKLAQRRIYTYLMNFFDTDKGVHQGLEEMKAVGIVLEKVLTRVVVGVPSDVERSEHIVLWETSEDLNKYKPILSNHKQAIVTRHYQDVEYFATMRENECLLILDNVLILGSELRVKEIIEAHNEKYTQGPKNQGLVAELKRVNKSRDAWFVFSLSEKEKKIIGRGDPVIDMTSSGLGVLKLGDLSKGNLSFDFSDGMNFESSIEMASPESASQTAKLMTSVLSDAVKDMDVKELGFDKLLTGMKFQSKKSDVLLNIVFNQAQFDDLISLVTQYAKSVRVQPMKIGNKAPAPVIKQEPAPAPAKPKVESKTAVQN